MADPPDNPAPPLTAYAIGERAVALRGDGHFIAPTAAVVGTVVLEPESSVWFGAVVRGDNEPITIGARSNVQDGAVLHTDPGYPLVIGAGVTVGHQAMLHGCTIGAGSLVGIQAIVLNGAVVGRECIVGAGALIPEGRTIPDRSLVVGSPARVVREVTDAEAARIREGIEVYVRKALAYRRGLVPERRG
jgi:carbonic anhydrase/acetyltransferase-like protein (isoleucine patch superfamily)